MKRRFVVAMILTCVAGFVGHSARASVPDPANCTVVWECLSCDGGRVVVCPAGDASGIRVWLRDQFQRPIGGVVVSAAFDADRDSCLNLCWPAAAITDVNGEAYLRIHAGIETIVNVPGCLQVVTTVMSMGVTLYRGTAEWLSPDMNADLDVGPLDFARFAVDYQSGSCRSDFDCNGIVDCCSDLNLFARHWLHSCESTPSACPVEPAITGEYFKVPASHPNTGIGIDDGVVAGLVSPTLGPNGLPVASALGATYRGPSGPITDVNTFGEILWWSTASPYGVLYEKKEATELAFNFPGFFPDGQGNDCDYYRAVHWHGFHLVCMPATFTLASDDDAWLFLDGTLVLDNGGVHGLTCVSTEVPGGVYTLDLFYIDRHRNGAGIKLSSDFCPEVFPCNVSTGDVACPVVACCDGMDNDGDGCIDYPGDLGCTSPGDDSEEAASCAACSDDIDNDLDGYIDYPADQDCLCPQDNSEGDVTSVADLPSGARPALQVDQNYPNPLASQTVIIFSVPQTSKVRLAVYDVWGRLVKLLLESEKMVGEHTAEWDGLDSSGLRVVPGIYICKLTTPESTVERKMVVVR